MQPVAGGAVGGLILNPSGRQLLVGAADGTLSLVDLVEGAPGSSPAVLGTLPGAIRSLGAKRGKPGCYVVGTAHGHIYK
jgi:hypothetical protein